MKNIREKISYLQGLAQGLDIQESTKEGKVFSGIIEILGEMAGQLEDIEDAQSDLEEYVETIDEDLYELEDEFFDEEIDEDEMVEVECPNCKEIVCFESDIVDDEDLIEVTCPNCDEVVYVNDQELLTNAIDADLLTNKNDDDDDL